jgi:hypothetical protein
VVLDRWSWSVFGCGFKPIESLRGIPGVPFSFLRGRGPSALRPGAGARGAGITAALSHVTVVVTSISKGLAVIKNKQSGISSFYRSLSTDYGRTATK